MFGRLLCILVILGSTSCTASDIEYLCPPYITVTSSIEALPMGWQALKRGSDKENKHFLEYVVFSDGHPQDLAYLRPVLVEEVVIGGEEFSKSVFDLSGVSPSGIYLVCGYYRTTFILSKAIGAMYQECEVLRSSADKNIESVKCR